MKNNVQISRDFLLTKTAPFSFRENLRPSRRFGQLIGAFYLGGNMSIETDMELAVKSGKPVVDAEDKFYQLYGCDAPIFYSACAVVAPIIFSVVIIVVALYLNGGVR